MNGYTGTVLSVDLNSGKLRDIPINKEYAHASFGGSGLAARNIFDIVGNDTDSLGPENPHEVT
jgi:aldehyde:ferredoxin oxidoreductase